MFDIINKAQHYNVHPTGIECIDVIKGMPFELANPVKYTFRTDHKNGLEDLEKSVYYLKKCDEETFKLLQYYNNPVTDKFINKSFEVECDRMPAYICQIVWSPDYSIFEDQIDHCIDMLNNRIEKLKAR